MKSTLSHSLLAWLALATSAFGAFAPGGTAYTKRAETALLAEPKMLANPVARLPYARAVKIAEVRERWLRVSAGRLSGWVFAGNLADAKPSETRGADGLPLAASQTSATAAARPLAPAAVDYADRRGLADAAEDVQWMEAQSAEVGEADVQGFLQEQKKGEYQ